MVDTIAGRFMFALGFFILFALFTFQAVQAFGMDYHVIEVRKNLQMSQDDPILHDYYLNAGASQGIRVGMTVKIVRRIPVYDRYQNKAQNDLVLAIAKLKIIHTEQGISIARLHSLATDKTGPILGHRAVMTGDRVDIHSAAFEDDGGNRNRKGASLSARKRSPKPKKTSRVPTKLPEKQAVAGPSDSFASPEAKVLMQ